MTRVIEEKFPVQIYKENVLADCFEDKKRYFLRAYIDVDLAHAQRTYTAFRFQDLRITLP